MSAGSGDMDLVTPGAQQLRTFVERRGVDLLEAPGDDGEPCTDIVDVGDAVKVAKEWAERTRPPHVIVRSVDGIEPMDQDDADPRRAATPSRWLVRYTDLELRTITVGGP